MPVAPQENPLNPAGRSFVTLSGAPEHRPSAGRPYRRLGVTAEALASQVIRLEGQPRSFGHSVSLSIETPCR